MRPATSRRAQWAAAALVLLIGAAAPRSLPAEDSPPPKAPVPPSPFLPVIYRYADAMLAKGRDELGPMKTGLFLSALDRAAPGPLAARPRLPGGLKDEDRPGGASGPPAYACPEHDQNLLRVLYTLSELSAKPVYKEAADAEIRRLFEESAGPWTAWDTLRDAAVPRAGAQVAPFRPWLLWDRAFDLAPSRCAQLAAGLAEAGSSAASMRDAGFRIRALAVAHARTGEARFLKAIEDILGAAESKARADAPLASRLSLAIDCDGAAHRMPGPLAARLRAVADREDDVFCGIHHDVAAMGGFLVETGESANRPAARTPLWETHMGSPTTAQVALLCVSRYENTGKVAYRELIHAAAEAYLASLPPEDLDAWPGTFGHAIGLQLAAWRSTAKQVFLDRARKLGDVALERFFDGSPLPRASLRSEHYETITGADTLALALVDLHLHILHITAVRCPPLSADR